MNFITIGWYIYECSFLQKIFESCSIPTKSERPWEPVDFDDAIDMLDQCLSVELLNRETSSVERFSTTFYIPDQEGMYIGYHIYESCNISHINLLTSQEAIGKLKDKYKRYIEEGLFGAEPSVMACYESEY